MNKKHFIRLAETLRTRSNAITARYARSPLYLTVAEREHQTTVAAIADFCQAQNPKFDRARWLGYIAGENGPNSEQAKRIGHKIADHVSAMERAK